MSASISQQIPLLFDRLKRQDWDESEFEHVWTPPTEQQKNTFITVMMFKYVSEGGQDLVGHQKFLEDEIYRLNKEHGEKSATT